MIPISGESDWDFGPVFDLIHSLSISGGERSQPQRTLRNTDNDPPKSAKCIAANQIHDQEGTQLGDFNKVWQYLGQPLDLPPPEIAAGSSPNFIDIWDGETARQQPTIKVVRWQDDLECTRLADRDEENEISGLSHLTKQQRKKARRKERRQEEREALAAQATNAKALPSGSEDESEKDAQAEKDAQEHRSQDRSSVIYQFLHGNLPRITPGRLRSGKLFRDQASDDAGGLPITTSPSLKPIVQISKPVKDGSLEVAAAKKQKLMSMLNERFIDDRPYLRNLSFAQIVANSTVVAAEGIHVFVDASNVCCNNSHLTLSLVTNDCLNR